MFLREVFENSLLTIYANKDDEEHLFLKENSYTQMFRQFEQYFKQDN